MPHVKTKPSGKQVKSAESTSPAIPHPLIVDVHELISKLLEYEDAARERGIELSTGRFKMLTNAERRFYRAELIADYIRLSAGNLGNTPGYFDASLEAFCSKICDMEIPSLELMGTYLAAADIASAEERLKSIEGFDDSIRRTMVSVLQGCVAKLHERTELHKKTRAARAA